MKKVLLFVFLVGSSLLYSQQCYKDYKSLVSDGKLGKDISFIFSDDYFYYIGNTSSSGLFGEASKLKDDGKKFYLYGQGLGDFYKIVSDTEVYLYSSHIRTSKMQKYDCTENDLVLWNAFIKKYFSE